METYYLQVTGKANIDQPLKKDKSYTATFYELDCYGSDDRSGQGQDDEVTFKCKSAGIVVIQKENDLIYGRPKQGSMSQKLRLVLKQYFDQQEAGNYKDFDQFYNKIISQIIEGWEAKLL